MKSKLVIWSGWLVVVTILLQSCAAGPAAVPATLPVNTLIPTIGQVTETPTSPATAVPTPAPPAATLAPSLTPSLPAPTITSTPTIPPRDPWLIMTENLAQFAPLASLGNSTFDQINLAVWAPDGARLAVGGKMGVTMFDTLTWKVLWRMEFPNTLKIQFSQDSNRLLVGTDKGVRGLLLESATGKTLSAQNGGRIALSPDGKTVAGAGIQDALSNELIRELNQPKLTVPDFESPVEMAYSQDGRKLVEGLSGGGFTAWDVTSGGITYRVAGYDSYNSCDGKSANSDWMVVVCPIPSPDFSKVSLHANFINLNRPNGFGRYIFTDVAYYKNHHYALLPDQPLIAWADGNKITLYDLSAGFIPVRTLPGLPANGNLSFSPGKVGQRIAYWNNRNFQIWDVNPPKKVVEFGGQAVTQMAFSPKDGQLLAYGRFDGSVELWNLSAQKQLFLYKTQPEGRVGVAFTPDGSGLASGGMDYRIRLWNLDSPVPVQLKEQKVFTSISQFAFTPDGKKLAVTYTGAYDVHIYSGSLDQVEPLQALPVRSADYIMWAGVAASPSGDKLAIGNTIGAVEVHDAISGALLQRFEGLRRGVARNLEFSADGRLLAVSTRGLWNLKSGALWVELNTEASSVAISPDQCLLAIGQNNGTLRFWNIQTGQFLQPLNVFASGIEDLVFSPDGRLLAMGNQDGDVVIWGMPKALEQPAGTVPKIRCGQ